MNTDTSEIVVADFNRDGNPDLLTDALFSHRMALRLGAPGGTFGPLTFVTPSIQYGAVAADINRDGRPALAGVPFDAPGDLLGYQILLNTTGRRRNPCVVPPVIGTRLHVANARLRKAACHVGTITTRHPSRRPGRVVSEDPTWGTVEAADSAVNLIVGR